MRPVASLLLLFLASCSHSTSFQERLLDRIPVTYEVRVPPAFASTGRGVAYVGHLPGGDEVVLDDWTGPRFGFICCLAISDDGSRAAFLGGQDGAEIIYLQDRAITAPPDRSIGWPFRMSGPTVAWLLLDRKGNRGRVVVNGVEGPEFEGIGHPELSADGKVVAYRASREDSWFIRVGDREDPTFDFVTDPALSTDGKSVAYGASRGTHWILRVNAEERSLPGKPIRVFISDDGRRAGWVERVPQEDGGDRMRVVVEQPGPPFSLVGRPVFSPTSAQVAYGAEDGNRKLVMIGRRRVDTPDRMSDVSFSPDGRRVGYGAWIGRELWWKVIDVGPND